MLLSEIKRRKRQERLKKECEVSECNVPECNVPECDKVPCEVNTDEIAKIEFDNQLLRAKINAYEERFNQIVQEEKARKKVEELLRRKMEERRLSIQAEKEEEEKIKEKISNNISKIKEIETKVKETSKNERLAALSQGKSPNVNPRKILPKSKFTKKQPSLSKKAAEKLTKQASLKRDSKMDSPKLK